MVLIHLKKGDESQFLCQDEAGVSLAVLVPRLAQLYNDRRRLERLVAATQDLLQFGPQKPQQEQGYSDDQLDELAKTQGAAPERKREVHKNGFIFYEVTCPTGTRVGLAAGPEAVGVVQPTLDAATRITCKEFTKSNQLLKEEMLKEAFEHIQAALTIIYPEGLPQWDASRLAIEDNEELDGTAASKDVYNPNEASLWWAGKELLREKLLSDYVGKNDKTKLVIKLQKKGQGPPVREAPISAEEQSNMMAYYYRKQEELKKLEENDDDAYLNSSWADPKSLKSAFTGMGSVKWK
ncbi:hypothetical protein HDV03_002781 [Kappamyces sp. JEL0829]|nr:hypothetical protein HDV03_002781 [Kappamyces sp. JEL0829]